MARAGKSGVQFTGAESSGMRKDSSFSDVARRKEVLVAKSVVDEVRRRVIQLRGGQTKSDKEKEEEKLEKARAAAWAWYQRGKGGKESISSSGSCGSGAAITVRSGELGHKSSRFKTEALKTSVHSISSPSQSGCRRVESGHQLPESGWSWDFSNFSVRRTSSLFDSYELDSVSRRIDTAFHSEGSPFATSITGLMASRPDIDTVHLDEWPSAVKPTIGLPPFVRTPRAATPYIPPSILPPRAATPAIPQVISISHGSQVLTSSPKVTRSSSLRMQFPRCICSSISDVVTHEEMSLGVDIAKCDCQKTRAYQSGRSGWSLRRITRAMQEFIHLPEPEYHPQQEHHERRHARLHLHHPYHQHDHEYHLHYQIKLRDGVHHGRCI